MSLAKCFPIKIIHNQDITEEENWIKKDMKDRKWPIKLRIIADQHETQKYYN